MHRLALEHHRLLQNVDGKSVMRSLGVPYGAYPRVALIYLLSQAVMKQSRDVYLGRNFTEWMRRLRNGTGKRSANRPSSSQVPSVEPESIARKSHGTDSS